jgi:hypothetical protein
MSENRLEHQAESWVAKIREGHPRLSVLLRIGIGIGVLAQFAYQAWIYMIRPIIDAASEAQFVADNWRVVANAIGPAASVVGHTIVSPLGAIGTFVAGIGYLIVDRRVARLAIAPAQSETPTSNAINTRSKALNDQSDFDALMMRMVRKEDAEHFNQRFYVERAFGVYGAPQLSALEPYIEFSVGLRNSTVFSVQVDREIEGRLRMDDQELGRPLQIEHYDPTPIHHGDYREFIFRQWLSPEAALRIRRQSRTVFSAGWLAVYAEYIHNAIPRYERIALGNQTALENSKPEGWQPLSEKQRAEIIRAACIIQAKPLSVLVLWGTGAEQFSFEVYAALCSGEWKARVEQHAQDFFRPRDNSIDVYGKDGEMTAHEFSGFLFVIFGAEAQVGSKLSLASDSKDDLVIVIGSK